jgi:hypothetical protein
MSTGLACPPPEEESDTGLRHRLRMQDPSQVSFVTEDHDEVIRETTTDLKHVLLQVKAPL